MRAPVRRTLAIAVPFALLATPALAMGSTPPPAATGSSLVSQLPPAPDQLSNLPPLATAATPDDETVSAAYVPLHAATTSGGTITTRAQNPAGCILKIDDAHVSTYLGQRGVQAVKVNAETQCRYAVQAISMRVDLYKTVFFGLFSSHQAGTTASTVNKAYLADKNTYRKCTNKKSTTWYGTAQGVLEEAGQTYVAAVQSAHRRSYNCGT